MQNFLSLLLLGYGPYHDRMGGLKSAAARPRPLSRLSSLSLLSPCMYIQVAATISVSLLTWTVAAGSDSQPEDAAAEPPLVQAALYGERIATV